MPYYGKRCQTCGIKLILYGLPYLNEKPPPLSVSVDGGSMSLWYSLTNFVNESDGFYEYYADGIN